MVPSGRCTWKNPLPSMATSSGLDVWFSEPWVMITSVAADLVPSPICSPAPTVDWLCAAPGVTRF
jgi:hypothetical protein